MALFEKVGTPILIGVGALILAPMLFPAVGSILKPIAREAVKGGLILVSKGRELVAETIESLEDIAAEAKAELMAEREVPSTESE